MLLIERVFQYMPDSRSADRALERLEQQGYRLTRPRRAIVAALHQARSWLRPEDLLARARRTCPGLGLVTVYRTLTLLEGLGLVRRIHVEPGCHGYAPAGLKHGHHLVCRSCNRVLEFPGGEELEPLIHRLARRTGFVVEDHVLELTGRCARCR